MGETGELGVRDKWDVLGIMSTSGLHFLQVTNLSQRKLAISVNFRVPVLLNGVAVWDVAVRTSAQVPA